MGICREVIIAKLKEKEIELQSQIIMQEDRLKKIALLTEMADISDTIIETTKYHIKDMKRILETVEL